MLGDSLSLIWSMAGHNTTPAVMYFGDESSCYKLPTKVQRGDDKSCNVSYPGVPLTFSAGGQLVFTG